MSSPASSSSTCIFPAKDPGLALERAPARAGDEVINVEQLHGLIPAPVSEPFVSFSFYLHDKAKSLGILPYMMF